MNTLQEHTPCAIRMKFSVFVVSQCFKFGGIRLRDPEAMDI